MNNDDKNKKLSTNYKDYKYVYTGYDDFIKEHHLDKKEIKQEKEQIIHDHRNVFDFNNPNQHTHDYSFDFSQEPTPRKETETYKDKYGNIYNKKPTISPIYNTTTTRNTTNSYNKVNENSAKIIKTVFFIIFVVPIILTLITSIIPLFIYMEESSTSTSTNETNTETYSVPVEKLCTAIENNNFSTISKYLQPKETEYYNANEWKTIIYNYDYYGNPNYNEDRICNIKIITHPYNEELSTIEKEYQRRYYTTDTIDDAYRFEIKIIGDFQETYTVKTVKIDGNWYLLSIKKKY